jgi:hypothetical protein
MNKIEELQAEIECLHGELDEAEAIQKDLAEANDALRADADAFLRAENARLRDRVYALEFKIRQISAVYVSALSIVEAA